MSFPTSFNKPIDLDTYRKKKHGASFIATPQHQKRFALNLLPPMNARPQIIAPIRAANKTLRLLSAEPIPLNFSWNNASDVATKGFNLKPRGDGVSSSVPLAYQVVVAPQKKNSNNVSISCTLGEENCLQKVPPPKERRKSDPAPDGSKPTISISDPPNQALCGCCWAVSSASAMTDRFAIATGMVVPLLSFSYLLECDDGTDAFPNAKCGGGFPAAAGAFMEEKGLPPASCRSFQWCLEGDACSGSGGGEPNENALSQMVPSCSPQSVCYSYTSPADLPRPSNTSVSRFYKAVKGSTQALVSQEAIQAEIFHHGPVVCTYCVFADMIARDQSQTFLPGWTTTNNIYVNMADNPIYAGYSSTDVAGFHAVTVVGWGIEPNPIGLPDSTLSVLKGKGGLKYWIIRNSWGGTWNGDGYWKCAWSYPDLGINTAVGLDSPTDSIGGGTTFMPLIPPSLKRPQYGVLLADSPSLQNGITVEENAFIISSILLSAACLLTLAVLLAVCSKR